MTATASLLRLFSPIKLRIKRNRAGFEVELLDELAGLGGPVLAVHAAVFPFNAERALVADVVEGDNDFFELDVTVAEGAEIPVAARVGERDVAAKDADGAVAVAPPG